MIKFFWLCFSYLLVVHSLSGQPEIEVDILNQKSITQREFNVDSVAYYAEMALAKSKILKYKDGEIEALINVCFSRYLQGNTEDAISNCSMAIEQHEASKSEVHISDAYLFLGLIYIETGEYDKAIEYFLPLMDLASKHENPYLLSDVCSNLGLAYLNYKSYPKAHKYYKTALKIHDDIEHPHGLVYIYLNVGRLFLEQFQYDSAQLYLSKTVHLAGQIKNQRALYYSYFLSGKLMNIDLNRRIEYLQLALKMANNIQLKNEMGLIYLELANLYNEKKLSDSIIHYSQLSQEVFLKNNNHRNLLRTYYLLVRANEMNNADQEKLMYAKKYKKTLDFINTHKSDFESVLTDANEMKDDERSYEVVKLELEAAEARLQQKNIIIAAGVFGIILIGAMLLVFYKVNQEKTRSNNLLKKLNEKLDGTLKEKDLLLGMVVHDLRSPLSKIQGILELLNGTNSNLDEEQQTLFDLIGRIVVETKGLTEELLEVNQLESGIVRKKEVQIEIKEFIEGIIFHYSKPAKDKGVKIETTYKLSTEIITSDKLMLQRIIENLISNAIKFNDNNGVIDVNVLSVDKLFSVIVKDNGPGIAEEEQNLLFRKFGKTSTVPTANESSTGLGLYIVKNLIDNLNGTIRFESKLGQGAEFRVDIPQ